MLTSLANLAGVGSVMEAKTSIMDDPRQPTASFEHVELSIGGMHCPHCPSSVEKALKSVPGVRGAHVNLANETASIDFDPGQSKVTDLLRAIRSVGYTAGTAKIRIPIKRMHCASCVTRIELALQMTPGIVRARASLGTNAVDIEYQPEKTSFEAIRNAIESAGHRLGEHKPVSQRARKSIPRRRCGRKSIAP